MGETRDSEVQQRQLYLVEAGSEKFWFVELEGSELRTHSGKVGTKGRRSTKDHGDIKKAQKAYGKALKRKIREGYWERDGAWPSVIEVDESQVPESTQIELVELPRKYNMPPSLRHVLPPHLHRHGKDLGFYFYQGPGRTNLWFGGGLSVGREHFIRRVEPLLEGEASGDFHWLRLWDSWRPDGDALLLGHQNKLYEICLNEARAELIRDFGSREAFDAAAPFVYRQDGGAVFWRSGHEIVQWERVGQELSAFFDSGEEPVVDLCRLANGDLVGLFPSVMLVFNEGGESKHELILSRGFGVSTWLDGRVLVLKTREAGPSQALLYGLHEGQLHEMTRLGRSIRAAFDSRGEQFFIEAAPGGDVDWTAYRVFNVEAAWAACREKKALEKQALLVLPSFHDAIIEVKDARAGLSRLDFVHSHVSDLEQRAFNGGLTPLGYAVWHGRDDIAQWFVDKGADPNGVSRSGEPPLTTAILRGHWELVELLLAAGAKPSLASSTVVEGEERVTISPIWAAARWGHRQLLERFVELGADINATGDDRYSLLEAALLNENEDLAEWLVAKGAKLNQGERSCLQAALAGDCNSFIETHAGDFVDIKGATGAKALRSALLSLSVGKPLAKTIDAMLAAGAKDDSAEALYRAVDAGHPGAVRAILAAGADPNEPHYTATNSSLRLHQAVARSAPKLAIVQSLVDAGAALDAIDNRGVTPLRYAIANNKDDLVSHYLLESGASLTRGESVWGPLHQAAAKGNLKLAKDLLARGAAIDSLTAHHLVPLEVAINNKQQAMIDFLIEAGAKIDGGEFTPLMSAAVIDDVVNTRRLLKLGANPKLEAANPYLENDTTRRSAQEHAESAGAEKAAKALADAAGGGFASLIGATKADDLVAVKQLLAEGAKPNKKSGDEKQGALHLARSAAVLRALIEGGASVNLKDDRGRTPLMVALQRQEELLARAKVLIEGGAKLDIHDNNYLYPLDYAVRLGDLELVKVLIDAGAKVDRSGMGTKQPLHYAAYLGHLEIAAELIEQGASVERYAFNIHGTQMTPLHEAADGNHPDVAELLIKHGAEPSDNREDEELWDESGISPIHIAARADNFEVMRTLLRHDDVGAIFESSARGLYAEDYASSPRLIALIQAVQEGQSVDDFLAKS